MTDQIPAEAIQAAVVSALQDATPEQIRETIRAPFGDKRKPVRSMTPDEMKALIDSVAHDIVEHRWPHIDAEIFEELRQAHLDLAEKIITEVCAARSTHPAEAIRVHRLDDGGLALTSDGGACGYVDAVSVDALREFLRPEPSGDEREALRDVLARLDFIKSEAAAEEWSEFIAGQLDVVDEIRDVITSALSESNEGGK